MTCRESQDLIGLYSGGDLPGSEAVLLEGHLAVCPDCAELADALNGDRERLKARPPELADIDFAAMRRELRGKIVRGRLIRRCAPVAAIAAALVAALLVPGSKTERRAAPVAQAAPQPTVTALASKPVPKPVAAAPVRKSDDKKRSSALQSDVEMRLTTEDPSVVIILLPVTTENSNE
jgi:hypothetical protein